MPPSSKLTAPVIASYLLMALTLWLVMQYKLLAALFSGLLVYALVHLLAPPLARRFSSARARIVVIAALSVATIALLSLSIWGMVSFFTSDAGSVESLLQKAADIIEASRSQIPPWLTVHLPTDANALRAMLSGWLREHSDQARLFGQAAGRTAAHVLIGMVLGAMAALHDSTNETLSQPLAAALRERAARLSDAFERIVFAQVRIAAINAVLTAAYVFIILPLAGIHLATAKSIVAITFFAGLLPVVGNLISNTVLVVAALSHSLQTALASLVFMVIIHKLEYFLNARIVGAHINARAWELLVAMVVMEAIYGIPGVVAAPVFYAYIKQELTERRLI